MELNVATLTVVYQGGEYQVEVIEPTDAIIKDMGSPNAVTAMAGLWTCVTKVTGPQGDVPLGTIPLRFMNATLTEFNADFWVALTA